MNPPLARSGMVWQTTNNRFDYQIHCTGCSPLATHILHMHNTCSNLAATVFFLPQFRVFKSLAWLQVFFLNRFGERLPSISRGGRRNSKNSNFRAIRLVRVIVHSIWAVQCCTNFPTHDGPFDRQFGGSVCFYG